MLEAGGALRGTLDDLLSNENYIRSHSDVLNVKPDRTDFAADVDEQRCG